MGIFLKTIKAMAQVVKQFISFFLIPSPVSVSSGVSTKWKGRSLGDLVWPRHCWQMAFRSQCKGLQKEGIVPSGTYSFIYVS